MTNLGKAFATLVFIGIFTGFLAVSAYADSFPGTMQITITADFGYSPAGTILTSANEDFQASYQLENIGSPVVCGQNQIPFPCSGGNFILVPGSLTFNISGAIGPFTLTLAGGGANIFNFNDAAGDLIQIDFLGGDEWETPGTYSPFANVTLYCTPATCATNGGEAIFTTDGSIVETEVPEPKSSALLALGMIGLLFCANFMKRCPR